MIVSIFPKGDCTPNPSTGYIWDFEETCENNKGLIKFNEKIDYKSCKVLVTSGEEFVITFACKRPWIKDLSGICAYHIVKFNNYKIVSQDTVRKVV